MGGRLLDWLGAGVASSLPDPVTDMPSRIVTGSTAFYWATDTKHLFVYDPAGGPAWFDIDMAAITAVSTESIQDMIATFLSAGTGITLTYNDAGNLLTIAGTVTQYTDEMAQDAVAAMIAAGTDTGLTIVYNDAGNAIAFTITVATASDIWGGTLDTAFITPKRLKDWRTPVSVTDAATITLDGSLGANFYVTLGGNRILANPTNFNPGQFGVIHVTQDGTGTRTLTFGANWKFGSVSLNSNVLTTTAGAVDAIHYYVRTDGTITCFIVSNLTGSPAKLAIDNLSNVAISSPANGQVLTYDSGTGKWKNAAAAGGSTPWDFVPPTAASFSQASGDATNATLTDDSDIGLQITNPVSAALVWRTCYRTLTTKTSDWTFVARMRRYIDKANFHIAGLHLQDSITGKCIHFDIRNDGSLGAYNYNDLTNNFASTIVALTVIPAGIVIEWQRIRHVGTNMFYDVSPDGKTWTNLASTTDTVFLTNRANRVGFSIAASAAPIGVASVPYFSLTGPGV